MVHEPSEITAGIQVADMAKTFNFVRTSHRRASLDCGMLKPVEEQQDNDESR
jgi:hypothetical protein